MNHAVNPIADRSIADLLEAWIGLDADTVGMAAIDRAVRERMKALGVANVSDYAGRASTDPGERDLLVEEVIVAESWFFRDQQVFDFVTDFAVTRTAFPGRPPLRILSAPAAAGEEPYSVAMALLDAGLLPGQFTIDAVDISRRAVGRAEAGRYSANAFRNADLAFRDRWFTVEGSQAVIDPRVRAPVHVAWANLLDATFAVGRAGYDVIFCRNLLIYLTPAARGQVERQLERLLLPDGLLILGAAEPPIMQGDWIPAGPASLFALRRGVHARPPRAAAPTPRPVASSRRAALPPPDAAAADLGEPRLLPGTAKETKAMDGFVPGPIDLEDVLAEADRLANAGRLADAIAHCERHRPLMPPSPQLFFLMGMLWQSSGDVDRAEGCFHKTLYLDASHEEALLALALLARQRGDTAMAEKYRQSAARAIARKEESR